MNLPRSSLARTIACCPLKPSGGNWGLSEGRGSFAFSFGVSRLPGKVATMPASRSHSLYVPAKFLQVTAAACRPEQSKGNEAAERLPENTPSW